MTSLRTPRLELVAATLKHVVCELSSPAGLGEMLDAEVPESWPPGEYDRDALEFFRARLEENDAAVGWYGWYAIHRAAGHAPALIGAGGYLGPPDAAGVVEIGYSIAPEFQRRAFATELVGALVANAFSFAEVNLVIAHTGIGNEASMRVLERCGLSRVGPGTAEGLVRYVKAR